MEKFPYDKWTDYGLGAALMNAKYVLKLFQGIPAVSPVACLRVTCVEEPSKEHPKVGIRKSKMGKHASTTWVPTSNSHFRLHMRNC